MTEEKTSRFKTGIYRHYKGKLYHVVGEAIHSETLEPLIVYRALYGEYRLWVRPKAMFFEIIELDGKKLPRFALEVEVDN